MYWQGSLNYVPYVQVNLDANNIIEWDFELDFNVPSGVNHD